MLQLADDGFVSSTIRAQTLAGKFQDLKTGVGGFFESLGRGLFESAAAEQSLKRLEGASGGLAAVAREAKAGGDDLIKQAGSVEKAYADLGKQIDTTSGTISESFAKQARAVKANADKEVADITAI